jgi:4-amino-4-deoxy-L-arabinose transferase-like glycosyltransferase
MNRRSIPTRDLAVLVGATLAALLPFTARAFNVDDSVYLWVARRIQAKPWDFYGFSVNWNGVVQPMHEINKNPPLVSYYIALAARLVGWSEVALHLAFLVPAVAAVLGSYLVARRFCAHPLEAALLGTMTPVFLASSTTLMCDVSMLALFLWALWAWIEGLEENRPALLALSGVLAAACALTKYFGVSLVPLLLAWSLMSGRRASAWGWALLIPVVVLAAYQWLTWRMYGRGLLLDAAGFAAEGGGLEKPTLAARALVGVLFVGGCCIPALFYAPFLWSRRVLLVAGALCLATALLFGRAEGAVGPIELSELPAATAWATKTQMLLAAVAGTSLLAVAGADLARYRDRDSALLFMWLGGTFVFASFVNWTNSGRSILPMAPVAGILLVRRIEARLGTAPPRTAAALRLAFLPGLAVALAVTWSDSRWANSIRDAAGTLVANHSSTASPLWFEGHWGFQYYMQLGGARPLDLARDTVQAGELVVIPMNNVELLPVPDGVATVVDRLQYAEPTWIRTMSAPLGAGFYSSLFGPLPYAVGRASPDRYFVYRAKRAFRFDAEGDRTARE